MNPTKLTPESQSVFIEALGSGYSIKASCALAGFSYRIYYDWMKAGRKQKKGKCREFCDAVKKAKAEAACKAIDSITSAFDNHWQAAAWFLERTDPATYGSHRKEISDLKKQIAELEKIILGNREQ